MQPFLAEKKTQKNVFYIDVRDITFEPKDEMWLVHTVCDKAQRAWGSFEPWLPCYNGWALTVCAKDFNFAQKKKRIST